MENGQATNLGIVSLQIALSYKLPIALPCWPTPSPSNSPLSDSEMLKCRPCRRPLLENGTNFTGTLIKKNNRCYY